MNSLPGDGHIFRKILRKHSTKSSKFFCSNNLGLDETGNGEYNFRKSPEVGSKREESPGSAK